ncbi:ABC transporter permease [Agrobacterium sp. a22-2]|uniref:ABC transporter permease n=1 Tax=Agrobacterium sp. a22-2 TaxID=2283840 RepID=UPI001446CF2E|nr:ABC transporter permease [Agrobacterium sp. a22-2]
MSSFFIQRVCQAIIAIFGVMTLIFFLQRLAGDPTLLLVPQNATQADIDALRVALGFDRPLLVQYLEFIWNLVRFDLGRSYVQNVPVGELIWSRLPYTLMLAGGALTVAFGFGIPIGITLAIRRGRPVAKLLTGLVLAGQSMPTFWSAILMIMVFGVWLGWAPPSGAREAASIVMPSIALGLLSMATFARVARTAVLDELEKDYIRTGHAKGLPMARIVTRHLLRNASIPVVTVAALEIANLLAGAVIVETVFAWPGLGQLTMQAITARDFLVVQGVVLMGATTAICLNLTADLLYSLIDPRIRVGGASQ